MKKRIFIGVSGIILMAGFVLVGILNNTPLQAKAVVEPSGGWAGVIFHLHGSGKAYAVSEDKGEVLAVFDTGKGAGLGSMTPDAKKLYVSHAGEGEKKVSVIDVASLKKIGEIVTGSRPKHALVSPNGKLLGVDHWGTEYGKQKVVFVDTATDKIAKELTYELSNTVFTGVTSMHNAWSADSRYFFTITRPDKKVLIVDTKDFSMSGKAFDTIPHYIVPSNDGKELWVVTEGTSDGKIPPGITIFDLTKKDMPVITTLTMPVDKEEAIEGHHGNFTVDGKFFYMCNRGPGGNFKGRAVAVYDAKTKKLVTNLTTESTGIGHAYMTPDGRYSVVTNYGNNVISIIDTKTHAVVKNLTIGTGRMGHVAFTKDGKKGFVSNDKDGALYEIDMTKFEVGKKIETNGNPGGGMVLNSYYNIFEIVPKGKI
jgi:YVTN family beta-propeller protein